MPEKRQLNTIIDKLTRSIENALSGDCFKTDVLPMDSEDIKNLVSKDWFFNWKVENERKEKLVYKLVILDNSSIIQGLISLQDKDDHIYMHLI